MEADARPDGRTSGSPGVRFCTMNALRNGVQFSLGFMKPTAAPREPSTPAIHASSGVSPVAAWSS